MAVNKSYNGTTYSIPQNGDENWGTDVTAFLSDVATKENNVPSTSVPTAGGTLTPSQRHYKLAPASAVTLNTTTAITDGSYNGQELTLQGTSDTNTVTIQHGANTNLNGDIILGNGHMISLVWDSTNKWSEIYRSN